MPYAKKICGIYSISTPNGNSYVGSSYHVLQRWAEHRCHLRGGYHHSARLQAAYHKHGDRLKFTLIEECPLEKINEREQFHIVRLGSRLNTSQFVKNIWDDPEVRAKFMVTFSSPEYREKRSRISRRISTRWVKVICSDGREFPNMYEAAKVFGVRTSGIKYLVENQNVGKLGVRLRRSCDPWWPSASLSEKMVTARKRNGTLLHSEETKALMKERAIGRRPSAAAIAASRAAVIQPVFSVCCKSGVQSKYTSIREAAEVVHPSNKLTAQSQISKACSGVKKTAYGFAWARSKRRDEAHA